MNSMPEELITERNIGSEIEGSDKKRRYSGN